MKLSLLGACACAVLNAVAHSTKRLALVAIASCLLVPRAHGQEVMGEKWARFHGDQDAFNTAEDVAVDAAGNVVVCGSTYGGSTTQNGAWIGKFAAADGALLWEHLLKEQDGGYYFRDVEVDGNGDVIASGLVKVTATTRYVFYTAKYRGSDGQKLWEQTDPGLGHSGSAGMVLDQNGNVILIGNISVEGSGEDFYTAKYAGTDGALVWAKTYNGTANDLDLALHVGVDADGNVIVSGNSDSPLTTGGRWPKVYTVKYAAADGSVLWEQRLNAGDTPDSIYGFTVDPSGNVILTGSIGSVTIVKLAGADGDVVWNRPLANSSEDFTQLIPVDANSAGDVFATGQRTRRVLNEMGVEERRMTIYTAKFSGATGDRLWEQENVPRDKFGSDRADEIQVDGSGNPVIMGFSYAETGYNSYTASYNGADGALLWEQVSAFSDGDIPKAMAVASDGTVAVVGERSVRPARFIVKYGMITPTPTAEPTLWVAGRDLAANEKPDRPSEANAVNETVPAWSYGYRLSAEGTDLTLFTPEQHINALGGFEALEGWNRGSSGPHLNANTGTTNVVINNGFGNLKPIFPGQLFIHPPFDGGFAVTRWTAPASGRYNIVARWLDVDPFGGNGVACHMIVNGVSRFSHNLVNGGVINMPSQAIDILAGQVVDFLVGAGPGGDFSFDGTALNAAISLAPAVEMSVPGAVDGKVRVTEGQNVVVSANVRSEDPAATVELRDNGKVVGRDSEAPYQFTIENIESGTHSLRAVAIDARGVEGASNGIELMVVQNAAQTRTMARTAGDPSRTASAETGTSYFFTELFGDWNNPFSWTPIGVPGPNDDAFITGPDGIRGSVVVLKGKFDVGTLSVGSGSKIVVDAGAPRFDRGLTGLRGVWLNDCDLEGFELVVGSGAELSSSFDPRFKNMVIFNNGDITYHTSGKTLADAASELRNNGTVTLQRNPASNVPVEVTIPQLQHNGGRLEAAPGAKLICGPIVINAPVKFPSGGGIVTDNGAGVIGQNGATLVGNAGNTLIGPDGASLVGPDGASIISELGSGLQGPGPNSMERDVADAQDIVLGPGAVITGRGNIVGNVINQGGFIAPGSSADVIRILGNYTQQSNGTLVLEVAGTVANPPQFDQLQITGTATLGGNLIVKTIDGFTPQSGDTFSPLTYASATGNFASVTSNAQVSLGPNGMTMEVSGPNPPAPKALNIATRMKVETGDNVLIAGFIITGSQSKKVIIRGIGPSLPFGGVLADPTLNLDNGAVTNDDWRTNQEQEIIATTIPPSNNQESAIVATLNPGPHTAILGGKGGATGIGVVEVYDLESGSPVQLANISSRGFVQSGDNVMIGGFIIGGTYPTRVIIRAIGPSLPFAGVLQNPTLELVDSNGSRISNDDWRATQEAEIIATTVPPTHEKEAAIFATLVPGPYTAIVRGKDDTVGIAVVEAYNLQ